MYHGLAEYPAAMVPFLLDGVEAGDAVFARSGGRAACAYDRTAVNARILRKVRRAPLRAITETVGWDKLPGLRPGLPHSGG